MLTQLRQRLKFLGANFIEIVVLTFNFDFLFVYFGHILVLWLLVNFQFYFLTIFLLVMHRLGLYRLNFDYFGYLLLDLEKWFTLILIKSSLFQLGKMDCVALKLLFFLIFFFIRKYSWCLDLVKFSQMWVYFDASVVNTSLEVLHVVLATCDDTCRS